MKVVIDRLSWGKRRGHRLEGVKKVISSKYTPAVGAEAPNNILKIYKKYSLEAEFEKSFFSVEKKKCEKSDENPTKIFVGFSSDFLRIFQCFSKLKCM